jgi:O-acetyl-ADP-ribose deacetylase (regulator of RNase III)
MKTSCFVPQLDLRYYREAIHLDQPYTCADCQPLSLSPDQRIEVIGKLIDWFANEGSSISIKQILNDFHDQRQVLRALLNTREPNPLDACFLQQLNRLLQIETHEKEIVTASTFEPVAETIPEMQGINGEKLVLWQGDITCLAIDAIVNAANSQLLGCFQPLHSCIDNAIHSAAGPQLREDCDSIIRIQGISEKTGDAKITRAYNLPTKFVLHTVGPIVPKGTSLTNEQQDQLAACYVSCLELASRVEPIRSISFCAISTGVFGFPKEEAAQIAVRTVNDWMDKNPSCFDQILYCVFSDENYCEYVRVFQGK